MIFLPDTNACISLLRQKDPRLIARWRATKASDIVLCSIVVYELRHGAERGNDPAKEHAKLDLKQAHVSRQIAAAIFATLVRTTTVLPILSLGWHSYERLVVA